MKYSPLRRLHSFTRPLVELGRLRAKRADGHAREIFLAWAILALLTAPAQGLGHPRAFDEYVLTSWSDDDGFTGYRTRAIAQDPHGYIWLATENGLIRFDGVRFTRVEAVNGTSLPARIVSSLLVTRDGSLWVGFFVQGVSQIRDGRLRNYTERDGFTGDRVETLVEDRHGTIWAGTRQGLYRFADGSWEQLGPAQGLPEGPAYTVYEDRIGTLWVGSLGGLFRRSDGQDRFEAVDKSLTSFPAFSEDPSATMWVTDPHTGFRTLLRGDRPNNRPFRVARSGNGRKLFHDRRGNLWVATIGQGLWFARSDRAQNHTVEVLGTDGGLSSDTVLSLFEDREGNIWVGTQGAQGGLHKFSPRRVTPLTDLGIVRAVAAGSNGQIWVGTATGVVRFSGTERRWYGTRDGLPSSDILALQTDAAGTLWAATGSGVARFADGRFTSLPLLEDSWPSRIGAISADLAGNLWICDSDRGLLRWHGGRLARFDPSPQVSHTAVRTVAADRDGRIWLTITGGGIGVLEPGGTFRLLRPSDGSKIADYAIHVGGNGAIWFGGGDRLSRFKDGRLTAITPQNGFPSEIIVAITDDDEGNLWIGTTSGIVRFAESEFNSAAGTDSYQLEHRVYDSSDGLAGLPVRLGYRNAIRGTDGRLWFVTGHGLTVVNPQELSAARPSPEPRIEKIVANGQTIDLAQRVLLPSGTTSLQFDYSALTFIAPKRVQFRYRLEGFEENWVDAGTRRQAFYTNLPPRTYRFLVVARSHEGIWNEESAVLAFAIRPTFYQTVWFYPVCAVVVVVGIWAGWQWRLRQMRRRFALILAERVRLGREIHDTLLQSLVGVALQLEGASGKLDSSRITDKEQLGSIRRQVEQYIREARQSIWDLRSSTLESRDLATALREAGERAVYGKAIEFEFAVDGSVRRGAAKIEEQVLRIGEEAISNAVRHAGACRLRIQLHYEADSLRLKVSDDGSGFNPNDHVQQVGRHCGLLIMQERAEQVGGTFKITTRLAIGTEIEALIPISFLGPAQSHVQTSYSSAVRG